MSLKSYLSWRNALFLIAVLSLFFVRFSPPAPPPPLVRAAEGSVGKAGACAAGEKKGKPDYDQGTTRGNLHVSTRTPSNYDPTRAYPLIIAFPPAGYDRARSEALYDLTAEATRRGYVLAFPEYLRVDRQTLGEQATVFASVAERLCVDADDVTLLGFADGGVVAERVPTLPNLGFTPRMVVASAAGVRDDALNGACPAVQNVMILHGADDRLFPGYGRSAAAHWAKCAACASEDFGGGATGCHEFKQCASGRRVVYCETEGGRGRWLDQKTQILDFIFAGRGG